jgi:hypothetical protein
MRGNPPKPSSPYKRKKTSSNDDTAPNAAPHCCMHVQPEAHAESSKALLNMMATIEDFNNLPAEARKGDGMHVSEDVMEDPVV